ncbi:MAG: serpin family protein [Candidatus Altiarchaeota archaeon]|nr:serpin family protein [Candidatus Altiarchaeota archaeon]
MGLHNFFGKPKGQMKADANRDDVGAKNKFALELYSKLRQPGGNLFFSPFSISTALAMAYVGAHGKTRDQMGNALHFDSDMAQHNNEFRRLLQETLSKGSWKLNIANALWGQEGIEYLLDFTDSLKRYYGSELQRVDFRKSEEARVEINKWVEERTNGKIEELIGEGMIQQSTLLVLVNAIWFNAKWANPFKGEDTYDAEFKLLNGGGTKTPFMHQTEFFNYAEYGKVQILEMPYEGNELSMIIFLPKDTGDLSYVEDLLIPENIGEYLSILKSEEVIVTIPKFNLVSEFQLEDILAGLGMEDAFNPELADFSGMIDPAKIREENGFFISSVIHKAFVDVYELGTEAAAATAVIMEAGCCMEPDNKRYFTADHPFVFIILNKHTNSILFCGRLMKP